MFCDNKIIGETKNFKRFDGIYETLELHEKYLTALKMENSFR